MTLQGTVNKTGVLLICDDRYGGLDLESFHSFALAGNRASALDDRRNRREFIFALVTIFKKIWAGGNSADLCASRRFGSWRHILHAGTALSRNRNSGRESLTFGTLVVLLLAYRSTKLDQGNREIPPGNCLAADGRDHAFLSACRWCWDFLECDSRRSMEAAPSELASVFSL